MPTTEIEITFWLLISLIFQLWFIWGLFRLLTVLLAPWIKMILSIRKAV